MKFYTNDPYWRNMISFLNLTLMALFMTAYTSRFIFPQLSLEGQKLWILGLCPISRDVMLWSKFAFSAIGTIALTGGLMLMGTLLVRPNVWLAALQLIAIPVLCCGVSGISVGLGARFVDLKQTDPSRIASSLPGTLNLVISLTFVVAVIAAMALPCHLYSLGQASETPGLAAAAGLGHPDRTVSTARAVLSPATLRGWIAAGVIFNLACGAFATVFPMRLGIRAFRRMEL
jgi:ABC-2 type transport system permease protein